MDHRPGSRGTMRDNGYHFGSFITFLLYHYCRVGVRLRLTSYLHHPPLGRFWVVSVHSDLGMFNRVGPSLGLSTLEFAGDLLNHLPSFTQV